MAASVPVPAQGLCCRQELSIWGTQQHSMGTSLLAQRLSAAVLWIWAQEPLPPFSPPSQGSVAWGRQWQCSWS